MEQLDKIVREAIKKIQASEIDEVYLKELLSKQNKINKTQLEEIIRKIGENS